MSTTLRQPVPEGWEGILDPGEEILWQGRPGTDLVLGLKQFRSAAFGAFFAGFAVFWMITASQGPGGFWMFGLIHFSVGIGIMVGPPVWSVHRRKNTWYTLTDRRALIATKLAFKDRKLKSYPLPSQTSIEFNSDDLSTIHFASENRRGNKGRRYTVQIGFERIENGREVQAMMRQTQKDGE